MASRRDPEYAGQTDEFGNPITTNQTVPTGARVRGGGLGAPGTTGAQGTFDPLGAPGTTGADPTATGYDPSGGQGQLHRPTGAGGGHGHAHQQGMGRTGITTTEGYGTYETTGMGPTDIGHDTGGMGTRGGRGGYDTGSMGTEGRHGACYDTGSMGTTGGLGYDTGMGATAGHGTGYDTGMGATAGHGTGYDTGMGTIRGSGTAQDATGGQTRVGLHRDTDREKRGMTERILEHLPGTGRKST